jgi:large subunit ribosomal protein L24
MHIQSKLKKGDEVIVIAGKDKGKSGKISRVVTATNRVVVEGVNLIKRHVTQRQAMQGRREPGIATREAPLAVSNVMLKDPKTGKPTRVGYKFEANGSKVRVAKASGTVLDTIKGVKGGAKAGKKAPAAKKNPKAKSKE